MRRIGLDVDGVLANFVGGVIEQARLKGLHEHFPDCCHQSQYWGISERFSEVMKDFWLDETFWLGLKPLEHTMPLPFKPVVYITSRPINSEVTKRWLRQYYFPEATVITVKNPEDKLQHVIDLELDAFVDDYFPTVRAMRDAGINAYLYEAPYQRGHLEEIEGLPTIKYLSELVCPVAEAICARG